MKVAIHQPNYLPWCGYFAKMHHADVFIFLDDADIPGGQSYISRTKIRAHGGPQWLSVPVSKSGRPPINKVAIATEGFRQKHLKTLYQFYGRAPYYSCLRDIVESVFAIKTDRICAMNINLIRSIAGAIGLNTEFLASSSFNVSSAGDERLVQLVKRVGGTCYLSGPGGENYQDPARFHEAGLELQVKRYEPIQYECLNFPFVPGLSIVDAISILGPENVKDVLGYPTQGE